MENDHTYFVCLADGAAVLVHNQATCAPPVQGGPVVTGPSGGFGNLDAINQANYQGPVTPPGGGPFNYVIGIQVPNLNDPAWKGRRPDPPPGFMYDPTPYMYDPAKGDPGPGLIPIPKTAAGGSGVKPPTPPAAPAPGKDDIPNRHHRFPQGNGLREWFAAPPRNINVDAYQVELPESEHIGTPEALHRIQVNGQRYVDAWVQFRINFPNATSEQCFQKLRELENAFGYSWMGEP